MFFFPSQNGISRFSLPGRGGSSSARSRDHLRDSSSINSSASKGTSNYRIVPVYGQMTYKPVKGDEVDAKLSRWLNRRAHNKILFSRTGPSKYIYGRLEVGVNVSNNIRAENQNGHLIVTVY